MSPRRSPGSARTLRRDRRVALALFCVAVLFYAPGMSWGVPDATGPGRLAAWGSDELAPLGPLAQLHSLFVSGSGAMFNPQYPLMHYLVEALFQAPYLLWLLLTGGMAAPSVTYPFGLSQPRETLAVLTVLGRLPSVLMAGGVVVLAWKTASEWWGDRRAGLIAAGGVLLSYPMFYYARTSNVDMAALFWTAAGLLVYQRILRRGLTLRRSVALGLLAAAATATKDASYAIFVVAGLVVAADHLGGRDRESGRGRYDEWSPLLWGGLASLVTYACLSGLLVAPARFAAHVEFIVHGSGMLPPDIADQHFGRPLSPAGLWSLTREVGATVSDALGLPLALLGLVGLTVESRRPRRWLLIAPFAGVLLGVILPVRFVLLRFVLPVSFGLSLYLGALFASEGSVGGRPRKLVTAAATLMALAWAGARGADLTYQMLADSRVEAASWLDRHARTGDRVGYYGGDAKLPRVRADVSFVPMPGQRAYGDRRSPSDLAPEFVLVIPQREFEEQHEWTLPDSTFEKLVGGELGYCQLRWIRTPPLLEEPAVPFVNPVVRIFARTDVVRRVRGESPRSRPSSPDDGGGVPICESSS